MIPSTAVELGTSRQQSKQNFQKFHGPMGKDSTVLLKAHICRLESLLIRCLRVSFGISVRKKNHHTTICRMAKHKRISSILTQSHLCFLGHLVLMPDNHLPKQLLVSAPVADKHAAGGQKRQWNDVVSKNLSLFNLSRTWKEESQEHVSWCATI